MGIVRNIPDLWASKSKRRIELEEELCMLEEEIGHYEDIESSIDEQVANLVDDLNEEIDDLVRLKVIEIRNYIDDVFELFDIDNSNLNTLTVAIDYVDANITWEEKDEN